MSNRHLPPGHGGPAPDPGLGEPGSLREAHLAGYRLDTSLPSCPGCTRSGSLSLLQPGRTAPVKGLQARPDLWGCVKCGWEGYGLATPLGLDVRVVDPETGNVGAVGVSEAEQCFREQEHMDVQRSGGGGAKGRRNPKPGDKREPARVEQDGQLGARDRHVVTEKKTIVKSFRFTAETAAFLERTAMLERRPVQALVDEALADWAERRYCVSVEGG